MSYLRYKPEIECALTALVCEARAYLWGGGTTCEPACMNYRWDGEEGKGNPVSRYWLSNYISVPRRLVGKRDRKEESERARRTVMNWPALRDHLEINNELNYTFSLHVWSVKASPSVRPAAENRHPTTQRYAAFSLFQLTVSVLLQADAAYSNLMAVINHHIKRL